jgi:hypothetical protein
MATVAKGGEYMKKVFLIGMVVFLVALMATPVIAVPTQVQKLPVLLKFTPLPASDPNYVSDAGESWTTNGNGNPEAATIKQWRDSVTSYKVELTIEGADPIVGYSVAERPVMVYNYLKHQRMAIHEIHVISFPTEDGGFEGNTLLELSDIVGFSPPPGEYHIETHGTFHGTGAFEGQTIVASYSGDAGGTWLGYLSKP